MRDSCTRSSPAGHYLISYFLSFFFFYFYFFYFQSQQLLAVDLNCAQRGSWGSVLPVPGCDTAKLPHGFEIRARGARGGRKKFSSP